MFLSSQVGGSMIKRVLLFFVIAIVAGIFGFGDIVSGTALIGRLLFFAFLALAIASLAIHLARG